MPDRHTRRFCSPVARTLAVLLLATPVLAVGPQPPGAGTSHAVGSRSASQAIRIDNFAQVDDRYYRGSQPEGDDYAHLAALGVRLVIDLQRDGDAREAAAVAAVGLRFHRIPMTTHDRPAAAAVQEFLALVNDPANQPVYVHCQGGRHRTGTMTAIYRLTHDGWTADRAYAEMKQYEFGKGFGHGALRDFVYDYYSGLAKPSAATPAGRPQ